MSLYIVGINHRTAPVALRERVAFEPPSLPEALMDMMTLPSLEEGAIVSTCNRTELYCVADENGPIQVRDWLRQRHSVDDQITNCMFTLDQSAAVNHAFSVACGLDSMVLGEPQILGQMKDAYRAASNSGSSGPMLNRLFQQSFAVAKLVRTQTDIGQHAVSVAYAAVRLARQIFAGFERHTACLIGAGETIELTARHLHSHGLGRMIIANRNFDRAHQLAAQFHAYAIDLTEIADHLAEADIVISSTASPDPVVEYATVELALKRRRQRPMFIVDLAVPRDVDSQVGSLNDVYLYTIDDLKDVIQDNLESRKQAAARAQEIVLEEAKRFDGLLRSLEAVPLIREFRAEAIRVRDEVSALAKRQLQAGRDPEVVMEFVAQRLTQKLLHKPSIQLREAGEKGDQSLLDAARRLLGLKDDQ